MRFWLVWSVLALACASPPSDKPGDAPDAGSPPPTCGNGVLDDGEACDGANVPDCPAGMVGVVTCSSTCAADTSACMMATNNEIAVHVAEGTVAKPNLYVVSHMPDGNPISECWTDATGLCVFANMPADAMVTIGWILPPVSTEFLTTYTHLTPPQTIKYVIPAQMSGGSPTTAYANVPGAYAGATSSVSMNGCAERVYADFTTVHEHAFGPACLATNQDGVVYAEARDASAAPLAWSYLRQPVTGTTTFNLPAWNPTFSTLTARMTNVPTTTSTLRLECNAVVDELVPFLRRRDVSPPTPIETLAVPVPGALVTSARCTAQLSPPPPQRAARYCERRQVPPFTMFAFDGGDFLPEITTTFTSFPVRLWTCTFASQPSPNADFSECRKGFARGTTTHIAHQMFAPGDFVGTLTAPELGPNSPISYYNAYVPGPGFEHSSKQAFSDVNGYADYLDGRIVPATGESCSVYYSPY